MLLIRVCKAWEIKACATGLVLPVAELKRRLDAEGTEAAIADGEMAEGAIAGGHRGWNDGFSEKEEISTGDHVEVSEGLIGGV